VEENVKNIVRLKSLKSGAQDVGQQQSVCLACARPWVLSPALCKTTTTTTKTLKVFAITRTI
jgi:hypothetical protein